jgi:hypothetical protein
MTTIEATPAIKPTEASKAVKIEAPEFTGRYRQDMASLWEQSQKLFGFTPAMAEKFARQAAQDAASALAKSEAKLKFGKTNDDGKGAISEACKAKGVAYTNALNLARAIEWIGESMKNGINYGKTEWVLADKLAEYRDQVLAK